MRDCPLLQELQTAWPPADWKDVTVVLAVSGGADSVALLRAAAQLRLSDATGKLVVAHFDHRLREDSALDAEFVAELARQLALPAVLGASTGPAGGQEERAREQRYAFLESVSRQMGARYVATAHTADDQAETVLHRILRGTGLAGLGGIPRARTFYPGVALIRPLLGIRRQTLREYLHGLGQPFRSDPTNQLLHYTRNRLRHQLIPQLEADYNPELIPALTRLASLARETQEVIDWQVQQLWERTVQDRGDAGLLVRCQELVAMAPHLQREVLIACWKIRAWPRKAMAHRDWLRLTELVAAAARGELRRLDLPGGVLAATHPGECSLALSRRETDAA